MRYPFWFWSPKLTLKNEVIKQVVFKKETSELRVTVSLQYEHTLSLSLLYSNNELREAEMKEAKLAKISKLMKGVRLLSQGKQLAMNSLSRFVTCVLFFTFLDFLRLLMLSNFARLDLNQRVWTKCSWRPHTRKWDIASFLGLLLVSFFFHNCKGSQVTLSSFFGTTIQHWISQVSLWKR